MGKNMNKLYKKVNKLEVDRASLGEGVNNLTTMVREFTAEFKAYSIRETAKYEKYDSDVRKFNETLIKAVDSIDYLKENSTLQDRRSDDLSVKFTAHEKTCSTEIAEVKKRQNVAAGVFIGIMAIAGIVGFMYDSAVNMVEKEQVKNEKLVDKIQDIQNFQNRNFGNIQAIKESKRFTE